MNPNASSKAPPNAGGRASAATATLCPSTAQKPVKCVAQQVLPLLPSVQRAAHVVKVFPPEGPPDPAITYKLKPVVDTLAWLHGALYRVTFVHRMIATAYGQGEPGVGEYTFSGARVRLGSIAVDRSIIPLGTILYVQGYHTHHLPKGGLLGIADDIGGAVRGYHVDLYMPPPATVHDFAEFAAQRVTVYELKKVSLIPPGVLSGGTGHPIGGVRQDGAGAT